MCSVFWVGVVRGAAVRGVFGEILWPSESAYLDLACEEVRFFTCSKIGMCTLLWNFVTVYDFCIQNLFFGHLDIKKT